jgi:hypothetical protein
VRKEILGVLSAAYPEVKITVDLLDIPVIKTAVGGRVARSGLRP